MVFGTARNACSLHPLTTCTSMWKLHMSPSLSNAIFAWSPVKAETACSHTDTATIGPRTKQHLISCFSSIQLHLEWRGQYWDEAARVQPRLGRGCECYDGQEGRSLLLYRMLFFIFKETKHSEPYSSQTFAWVWRIQVFLMWKYLWNIAWIWHSSQSFAWNASCQAFQPPWEFYQPRALFPVDLKLLVSSWNNFRIGWTCWWKNLARYRPSYW